MPEKDGMRYPSIDELLEKVDSKYKLVKIAAKVATIIEEERLVVEDAICVKPVGIALEEILKDRVHVTFEDRE